MNMEPKNSQAVKLGGGRVEPHVEGRHLLFHWLLSLQPHTAALDCWGELGGEKREKSIPFFQPCAKSAQISIKT